MKSILLWLNLCLATLLLSACLEGKDLHSDKEEDHAEQSVEYQTIRVNITSDKDGVLCMVYLEYPFDDSGNVIVSPSLKAYTPINTYLQVPVTLEKLYVLVGTQQIYETEVASEVNLRI